ncbi:MAG: amino acid ABC transporter permease [Thermodesulfobacteriota bacterium]
MFDLEFLFEALVPALNRGLAMSLLLILPSSVLGLLLGILIGSVRAVGHPAAQKAGDWYAALFRGTPLLVQLMILYFGLPNLGIYFSPYVAAVLGFVLCSGAYHSEYVRGGLLSIKKGQYLAAQSLGFSTWATMRRIIVPQALRRALPGCGNELIYLIKYSSLAYIITFIELTGEGKIIASKYFRFTEAFLVVGFYYLVLVTLATLGLGKLEKRLYIPGFGRGHN